MCDRGLVKANTSVIPDLLLSSELYDIRINANLSDHLLYFRKNFYGWELCIFKTLL